MGSAAFVAMTLTFLAVLLHFPCGALLFGPDCPCLNTAPFFAVIRARHRGLSFASSDEEEDDDSDGAGEDVEDNDEDDDEAEDAGGLLPLVLRQEQHAASLRAAQFVAGLDMRKKEVHCLLL